MGTVIEQINSIGQWFVEFAGPMLTQSSVLILILLIVDFALRKKVRAVFRYWIWMLVLVKLVLPTSLSSPVSLGHWLGDKLPAVDVRLSSAEPETVEPAPIISPPIIDLTNYDVSSYTPPVEPVLPVAEPVAFKPAAPPEAPATPLTWQGGIFLAWLAVAAAMGLLLLQRALFVRGLVTQARKANRPMSEALEECRRCIGVRRHVSLKVSPNATTPAVCGLFRPVILVPQNLRSSLDSRHLQIVLLHELAHIKRGDLWVNLAQTALQIIYFYNPLLWLANAIIRRAREQAVDEAVLVAMGEKAQQYPQTLVDVAKLAFKRPALSLRLIGVVESKSALTARIKHILSRPMPKSAKLGLFGLLAVLITAAILLPMAKSREKSGWPDKDLLIKFTESEPGPPKSIDTHQETTKLKTYDVFFTTGEKLLVVAELYKAGEPMHLLGKKIFNGSTNRQKLTVSLSRTYENETHTLISHRAKVQLGEQLFEIPEFNIDADRFYNNEGWGWYHGQGLRRLRHRHTKKEYANLEGLFYYHCTDGDGLNEGEARFWIPGHPITQVGSHYWIELKMIPLSRLKYLVLEPVAGLQGLDGKIIPTDLTREQSKRIADEYRQTITRAVKQLESEGGFVATLPNGVTVELVGVCEHPSEGKNWWRPDGDELREAPYDEIGGNVYPAGDEKSFEFAISLRNLPAEHVNTKVRCEESVGGSVGGGSPPEKNGEYLSDFRWLATTFAKELKACTVKVGVAAGQWQPVAESNGKGFGSRGSELGGVSFTKAFEVEDGISITVADDILGRPCRMVAITNDGEVVKPVRSSGSSAGKARQTTAKFNNISLSDIKEFQFQTRPYEWVEFKNVSLQPGVKTNVLIEPRQIQVQVPIEKRPYVITFTALDQDKAKTPKQLFDLFNSRRPSSVRTFQFRSETVQGRMQGRISVEDEAAKNKVVEYFRGNEDITLIDARPAYTLVFKSADSKTIDSRKLLDIFNENHPRGVSTYRYQSMMQENQVAGYISVSTCQEKDKLVQMIQENKRIDLVAVLGPNGKLDATKEAASEGNEEPAARDNKETGPKFIATLPNGVKAELVGVCEHPSEGKKWWRPDGIALDKGLCQLKEDYLKTPENHQHYGFVARLKNPEDVSINWYIHGGEETLFVRSPRDKFGNKQKDIQAFIAALPKSKNATSVRFGATAEPWKNIATLRRNSAVHIGYYGKANYTIEQPVSDHSGVVTRVHMVHTFDRQEYALRMIAIKKSEEIVPSIVNATGAREFTKMSHMFHVPLEAIKEIRFQIRKYEWVEFKNVSLRLGVKTDVQIEVEKPEHTVELTQLLEELQDTSHLKREEAARKLGELKDTRAVEALIAALKDGDVGVRAAAARALGKIGDKRAVEPLIEAYHDQEYESFVDAIWALGDIGGTRAEEILVEALNYQGYHPYVTNIAGKCLTKLGWEPQTREQTVRYLIALERWDQAIKSGPSASLKPEGANQAEGPFELDIPIIIPLEADKQTPAIAKCPWLQFGTAQGKLKATLHIRYSSWPHTKWRVKMDILDAGGKVLGQAESIHSNSGIIERVPHVENAEILFGFAHGLELADAARFRLSIESFWTSQGNPIQFDKELPLALELSSAEQSRTIRAQWLRFERSENRVEGTIHLEYLSWPKAKWEVGLRLLDRDGKHLSGPAAIIENRGIVLGLPAIHEKDLRFSLGSWRTVSQAIRYVVQIQQILDSTVNTDMQVEVGGESITSDRIILRLIDPNSHPVVGASVGSYVDWSDIAENPPIWFLNEGRVYKATKVKSDEQGKIALATDDLFRPEWPTERTVPLIAIDKGHSLAGLCEVSGEHLGGEVTLTLQPVCRVHGRFSVSTFRKRGWSTDMLTLYTFWNKHKLCHYTSRRRQFEFLLPPGLYEIMVYSEDPTKAVRLPVVIKPGQKELDISEYLDNENRLSSAKTEVQAEVGEPRERNQLVWGDVVNGLRAAVEFVPEKESYVIGERVEIRHYVQNVSDGNIQIASSTWRQDHAFATDANGHDVQVGQTRFSGWPRIVRHILEPGETFVLHSSGLGFGDTDDPALVKDLNKRPLIGNLVRCEPGQHFIYYRLNLPDVEIQSHVDEKDNVPQPGDWRGALESGRRNVTVAPMPPSDPETFKLVLERQSMRDAILEFAKKYRARVCFEDIDSQSSGELETNRHLLTGTFSAPTIPQLLGKLIKGSLFTSERLSGTYVVYPKDKSLLRFPIQINISETLLESVVRRILDQDPYGKQIDIKVVSDESRRNTYLKGRVRRLWISRHHAMYALSRAIEETDQGDILWILTEDEGQRCLLLQYLPQAETSGYVRSLTEAWKDVGELIPVDFNDTKMLADGITLGALGQDVEGKAFVTCIRDGSQTGDRQRRFVLVQKDGTILLPSGYAVLGPKDGVQEKFSFDVPLLRQQIEGFRFQSRAASAGVGERVWPVPAERPAAGDDGKALVTSDISPPGQYALSFDGVDDYLLVPYSESLRLEPPFTVEMWIKPEFPAEQLEHWPSWGVIAQGCYVGTGKVKSRGFGIKLGRFRDRPDQLMIDYCVGNDRGIHAETHSTNKFDDWMHIYHVFGGDDYEPGHGHPLVMGKFLIPSENAFKGQIGEIRIWNTARMRQDIRRYSGVALTGNEPGLVACWTFEQSNGEYAYDISTNGNHARLGRIVGRDDADPTWVDLKVFSDQPTHETDTHVEVEETAEKQRTVERLTATNRSVGDGLIRGIVTDPNDEPIEGATVLPGRHGDNYRASFGWTATTDSEGQFTGPYKSKDEGKIAVLMAKADGYAPVIREIRLPPEISPVRFRLGPGQTIRGRVLDQQGKPIAHAAVTANKWGEHTIDADGLWRDRTDSEGRFVWTQAPQDEIHFYVFDPNYLFGRRTMSPRKEEYLITLKPAIKLHGKVTDAQTGNAIERFQLIPMSRYVPGHWLNFGRGSAKAYTSGQFEFIRNNPCAGTMIGIEAKGYKAAVSAPLNIEQGELAYNFKLTKATSPADLIRLPNYVEQLKVKDFLIKTVCVDELYAASMLRKLREESSRENSRDRAKNDFFEGPFRLGVDIPVDLRAGTRENPAVFTLKTMRFGEARGKLQVGLERRIITWPSLECSTRIDILDSQGEVLSTMRLGGGNGGIKIQVPLETHHTWTFYWEPSIDISRAKRFRVTVQAHPEWKPDVRADVNQGNKSSESKDAEDYEKMPSDSVLVRVIDTKGRIIPIKDITYTHVRYRDPDIGNPINWHITLEIQKFLNDGSVLVNHRDILVRKFLHVSRWDNNADYTITMCFQPKEGLIFSATTLYPVQETDILEFVVLPRADVASVRNVAPDELAAKVVDAEANPVANATVSVYPDYELENHPFKTDSHGLFRIPGFADRWCLYIKVEKDSYATQWLTDFEIGKSFTVTMDQSTVLQGSFVDDSGEQAGQTQITLAKNKLTMQPGRGNSVGPITITHETDDKGTYNFAVEPGLYDVKVAGGSGLFNRSRVFIGAGQIVSLPSVLKPGIRFEVKVVDSLTNKPIKGVDLWIDSRTTGRVDMKEGSQRKTNWRGSAVWESLMPGNTSFSIMKKGYCRWWSDASLRGLRGFGTFKTYSNRGGYNWQRNIDSLRFDLIPDMPVVVIEMEKGVKLSGRVLSPEGKPVAKAWVDVTPAEYPGTLTGDSRYRMITDEDGRFGIEEKYYRGYVPAGEHVLYNLCAYDAEDRWANAVSKPFASKPGDEFEFTLRMTRGGSVSGRVVDSEGNPVPNIEVEAIAKDNLDSPYFKPRSLTDENGAFTLGPMRQGTYQIQPDTVKGVNIARSPTQEKKEVRVVDGEVTSVKDLVFRTHLGNVMWDDR